MDLIKAQQEYAQLLERHDFNVFDAAFDWRGI